MNAHAHSHTKDRHKTSNIIIPMLFLTQDKYSDKLGMIDWAQNRKLLSIIVLGMHVDKSLRWFSLEDKAL